MSSPEAVVQVLRSHLRGAGVTYSELAERLSLSESAVKRMFGLKDMSLVRLADICKAAEISMEDVLLESTSVTPRLTTLTLEQETALIADRKLFLVAVSCLGHWTAAQILETYAISEAECVRCLVQLDRLGFIILKARNTYRLNVGSAFHWRADGPALRFLRDQIAPDFFRGNFDGDGEVVLCVPTRLSRASAKAVVELLRQLSTEISRLQQQDKKAPSGDRDGYTILAGFRSWEFTALTDLRRRNSDPKATRG